MQPVGSLPNLFIVADGMGGHKAGDLASRYTVEKFLDSVKGSEAENPISIIEEAVRYANLALMDKAKEVLIMKEWELHLLLQRLLISHCILLM